MEVTSQSRDSREISLADVGEDNNNLNQSETSAGKIDQSEESAGIIVSI